MARRFAAVPFPSLFLPSPTPKGHTNRVLCKRQPLVGRTESVLLVVSVSSQPTAIYHGHLAFYPCIRSAFWTRSSSCCKSYVSINSMTITEAIVNNGVIGIICGWLYWKKGLESAMIAHFSSDMVLHLIVRLDTRSYGIVERDTSG